jgi:hypothetical protein
MPATSQQQQKLFGLALSVKRGETSRSEASDEVLNIVDTMSEKDIEDFASTSHSSLPKKVENITEKVDMDRLGYELSYLKKNNPGKKIGYHFIKSSEFPSGYYFTVNNKMIKSIYKNESEQTIEDFAETSHSGLPKKVESIIRGFVRETYREKILGEVSYDSNGNLKIKKQYDSISDYEKVAKKGDHIWFGPNPNDFKGIGKNLLSKVLGKDSEGNVIATPFGKNKKFTIPQKNQKVIVVESVNEEQEQLVHEANDLLQADKELRGFMATIKNRSEDTNVKALTKVMEKYSKSFSDIEVKFSKLISSSLPKKGSSGNITFVHQLKSIGSIIDKVIGRGKNIMKISDLVRGAVLFKDKEEMNKWIADFRRKYSSYIDAYEFKEKGSDPTFGYYGSHHFDLKIDGLTVELQVMPAKLWKYKDTAHGIYNKWRTSTTAIPEIEKQLSRHLFRMGNENLVSEEISLEDAVRSYIQHIDDKK